MAEGFRVATGFVEVNVNVDENSARGAGVKASEDVARGIDSPNSKSAFKQAFSNLFGNGGGILQPEIIVPAIIALSPAIAAAISAALLTGLGLGFIGLAGFLLKDDPKIQSAAKKLSNDTIKTFTDAAKPLAGPFVQALNIFDQTVKAIAPDLKSIFASLAPAIKPLADGISGFVKNVMPGLKAAIVGSAPVLTTLGQLLPGLGSAISSFLKSISSNKGAIDFLKVTFKELEGIIIGLGYALEFLSTLYSYAYTFWTKLLPEGISAAWSFIKTVASSIASFFVGLWNTISGFFTSVASSIGNFFTVTIPGWINTAVGFFESLPGRIWNGLVSLVTMLPTLAKQAFDAFFFAIGEGIGLIIKEILAFPGQVENIFKSLWSTITSGVTSAWNTIKSLVSSGISSVVSFFSTLPGKLINYANSAWNSVKSIFNNAKSAITSTVSSAISTAVSFFSSLPGKAVSAISSLPSKIKGVFSGAGGWLVSAGGDILRGLTNGMKGAVGAAIDAAKRAAQDVISGLKHALGIGSPSKVAADEVGKWIPAGIGQGIMDNTNSVQNALNSIPTGIQISPNSTAPPPFTVSSAAQMPSVVVNASGLLVTTDPNARKQFAKALAGEINDAVVRYQKGYK